MNFTFTFMLWLVSCLLYIIYIKYIWHIHKHVLFKHLYVRNRTIKFTKRKVGVNDFKQFVKLSSKKEFTLPLSLSLSLALSLSIYIYIYVCIYVCIYIGLYAAILHLQIYFYDIIKSNIATQCY